VEVYVLYAWIHEDLACSKVGVTVKGVEVLPLLPNVGVSLPKKVEVEYVIRANDK
jgi:hypothetical protein